jgi:hypothetical protein
MRFIGDIIITDPCYIIQDQDWGNFVFDDIEKEIRSLGFKNFMVNDTNYGDWFCETLEMYTNKKLGNFCADSGLVSIFLLEEVLAYNPKYNDYKDNNSSSVTFIKNFNGEIQFKENEIEDEIGYIEKYLSVIGTGTTNFYTILEE